ncbi:MAG: hypothetical protein ACI8UP_001935, partial [Porticoccaceae bacterium]
MGADCHVVDMHRCIHAYAAVCFVGIYLLIYSDSGRNCHVYRGKPLFGAGIMAEIVIKNLQKNFGDFTA